MKQYRILLAMIVSFLFFTGCDSGMFVVTALPSPPVEYRSAPPYPGWIWIQGEWSESGGRYVWRRGYWTRPRPHQEWVPGHWEHPGPGYHWSRGHWKDQGRRMDDE